MVVHDPAELFGGTPLIHRLDEQLLQVARLNGDKLYKKHHVDLHSEFATWAPTRLQCVNVYFLPRPI